MLLASSHSSDRLPLRQLAGDLARLGIRANVRIGKTRPKDADVYVMRTKKIKSPQAYEMTIAPEAIEIRAFWAPGAYYGVQTLRDLIAVHGRVLPAMRIEDRPDFRRRGVYHDCSRGKVPKVRTVCDLVERLAHWKVNELQLYIENTFRYRSHPAIGVGYSPFTARDIQRIQDCCRKHHVRLVGSLASFGHMEKILCLPEYAHLAEVPGAFRTDHTGDLCPTDPGSIRLLGDLYGEFLPLLEAKDFNACCDETRQIGKGRSRRRADSIGVGRLYLEFVLKVHKLVTRHGKRLNIWGDIILAHPELIPEIPRDIVMLNWDYSPKGSRIDRTNEFAQAGLPLVCCPGTGSWQSHGTRMSQANANIHKFARVARENGAEGLLNTNWGDYGHRQPLGVSLHGFALGAACAWGGAQVRLSRFAETFAFHALGDRTGKLAAAIRGLGAWGGSELYHSLVEPLDPAASWPGDAGGYRRIDQLAGKRRALRRRLEQVKALRVPAVKTSDDFDAWSIAELDLARRMDLLACRRALAGLDLRAGKSVSSRTMASLARDMEALTDNFAARWRRRNKPSRLRDNLRAMRRTIAEARKLAK
jgi:hypothetical protein